MIARKAEDHRSHLRFGKKAIHSQYLVTKEDFVACHNQALSVDLTSWVESRKWGLFIELKLGKRRSFLSPDL